MEKPFFEVFPTLQMNEELKNLFALTRVTKVALSRAKDFLRVHIFSEKLIHNVPSVYLIEKGKLVPRSKEFVMDLIEKA